VPTVVVAVGTALTRLCPPYTPLTT
jgi:hypothetical protein